MFSRAPQPGKRQPDRAPSQTLCRCQQGSVLIAVLIGMTMVATLGAAMQSFVSTSTITEIGATNDPNAYYLAESGCQYAIKRVTAIDSTNATARNALIAELTAAPYVLTTTGKFQLSGMTFTTSGGFDQYKFTSKGTSADATISRSINYIIQFPSATGSPLPFDGTSGGALNANNWNTSGQATLSADKSYVTMNSGHSTPTQVSVDWTNGANTLTMPDLQTIWSSNNGFLTYEVQAKVRLYTGNDKDVMGGISFRLNTQGDTNISNDSFYGLSYVLCQGSGDLSTFCTGGWSDANKVYIVLWKQASTGTKTLLARQRASSVSGSLVNTNEGQETLANYATLVVRIQEQLDPDTGTRENIIYAFAGDPVTNPKGTIAWDYTKFASVPWQNYLLNASTVDCSGGVYSFIKDTTFLTTNFNTTPQDEIGLHALGRDTVEVADLAVRFNFDGGVATPCVLPTPGTLAFKSSTFSVAEQSGPAVITVSRTKGTQGAVAVNYATTSSGSTATSTGNLDYTAVSGTLSWGAGDSADKTFSIPITNDSILEGNETVAMLLSSPTNGAVLGSPSTAKLTIIDNTSSSSINTLNTWSSQAIDAISSGTYLSSDYTTSAGSNRLLVCAVTSELSSATSSFSVSGNYGGQSFTTISSTNTRSNRQHVWLGYVKESQIAAKSTSNVALNISAGSSLNEAHLYCGSYQGVNQTTPILDTAANVNSSGSTTVSFGKNVNVSAGGLILYALAANGSGTNAPSGYTEVFDRADSYYSQSAAYKKITTTGTENPAITLGSSNVWGLAVAALNPASAVAASGGTINFSASTYTVAENGGHATITATRTGGSNGAVGITCRTTTGGSAVAGTDYTSTSTSLSWANGDTANKTFTINITDNINSNPDKTVNLECVEPTGGASLGTPNTAVLTIQDNDSPMVARTYYMTFNSGTTLTLPNTVTTNTGCPSSGNVDMSSTSGRGLLNDADSTTCVPGASYNETWSSSSPTMSLYYNGAGYATAMNLVGSSVSLRARNQSSSYASLRVRLFYTTPTNSKIYFSGTTPSKSITSTQTEYSIDLSALSAINVPAGSKIGVEFSWSDSYGVRLAVNPTNTSDKLILMEASAQ